MDTFRRAGGMPRSRTIFFSGWPMAASLWIACTILPACMMRVSGLGAQTVHAYIGMPPARQGATASDCLTGDCMLHVFHHASDGPGT